MFGLVDGAQSTRQVYFENRSMARFAIDHYGAAALLYYPVGSRQPQAGAFAVFFCSKEGLKDAVLGLFVHATTGVGHGKHNVVAALGFGMSLGIACVQSDVFGLDS